METLSRVSSHTLPTLTSNLHLSHHSSPSSSPSSSTHVSCRFPSRQNTIPLLTRGSFHGSPLPSLPSLPSCNRNRNSNRSSNRSSSNNGNCRPSVTTCAIPSVTEADFDAEVLQAAVPVVVDFWATWCGPCRLILPVMEGIQKEYGDKLKVVKIETDPNKNLVEKYQVYGLPTIILFENGEVVPGGHIEGALTKSKLLSLIKEKLPSLVLN